MESFELKIGERASRRRETFRNQNMTSKRPTTVENSILSKHKFLSRNKPAKRIRRYSSPLKVVVSPSKNEIKSSLSKNQEPAKRIQLHSSPPKNQMSTNKSANDFKIPSSPSKNQESVNKPSNEVKIPSTISKTDNNSSKFKSPKSTKTIQIPSTASKSRDSTKKLIKQAKIETVQQPSSKNNDLAKKLVKRAQRSSTSLSAKSQVPTKLPVKKPVQQKSFANSSSNTIKKPITSLSTSNNLPVFIMELPAIEHKYKCPECSYDSFKRTNFIYHQNSVHSKVYEIVYQCIGCQIRYSQLRDCVFHTSHCVKISKIVDIQSDKDKRNSRLKRSNEPISSKTTTTKRAAEPTSSFTIAASLLSTNIPKPNWEILFFTELGRALVKNPDNAESLVKVVPIIQQITKEVVSQLGNQSSFK